MQEHECGLQWKRNLPGWMMWQIRENKPLLREQKPLKISPSCIVESPADVSSEEEAPFPSALAEKCSGISLRAWVRPRGCQKYMPSPALSYMCPQQLSPWTASTEPSRQLWAALCSSAAPPFHLCSLSEVWLATGLQMVLLIVWPANLINLIRSMKEVCFYCYLTDKTYL